MHDAPNSYCPSNVFGTGLTGFCGAAPSSVDCGAGMGWRSAAPIEEGTRVSTHISRPFLTLETHSRLGSPRHVYALPLDPHRPRAKPDLVTQDRDPPAARPESAHRTHHEQ